MMHEADAGAGPQQWSVACLCAEWCGVCRNYRAVFEQVAQQHPTTTFRWIDVEDAADAATDLEVESFPTVLIRHGAEVRFFGPLPPHAATLSQLLRSLRVGAAEQVVAAGTGG